MELDLRLDPRKLKLGELEEFEEMTGQTIDEAFYSGQATRAKSLVALVYLFGRKQDPSFTLDDARELDMEELQAAMDRARDNGNPTPGEPTKLPKKRRAAS